RYGVRFPLFLCRNPAGAGKFLRSSAPIRGEGCYTGPLDFPTGGTLYRLSDQNRAIGEMFSSIATRYDFLNRFLSLGKDRRWRREGVAPIEPDTGGVHLDVAAG